MHFSYDLQLLVNSGTRLTFQRQGSGRQLAAELRIVLLEDRPAAAVSDGVLERGVDRQDQGVGQVEQALAAWQGFGVSAS